MPFICALIKGRCIAGLVFLVGLVLGIVGWATSAYSALTGTTIFLICLFSFWPVRIALKEKEGGWLSVRGNNLSSLALLAVWAIYFIVVQATGGLGSMGYFIPLVVIWGVTWLEGFYFIDVRSVWPKKDSNNPIFKKKNLTKLFGRVWFWTGNTSTVIILLTFFGVIGYTAGAITLSAFIYVLIYMNIMNNVNLKPK